MSLFQCQILACYLILALFRNSIRVLVVSALETLLLAITIELKLLTGHIAQKQTGLSSQSSVVTCLIHVSPYMQIL